MIIDNRYEVYKTFEGGMGKVYLCLDKDNKNSPLILKTIKEEYLSTPNARKNFLEEANIWVQLGVHPNIVEAYSVQYLPETHDVYILAEYVKALPGLPDASLRSLMLDGQVNQKAAINYGLHVIYGMLYSLSVIPDLVHCDLKPENLLIGFDKILKICDFGISKSTIAEFPSLHSIQNNKLSDKKINNVGTPLYMSPEQYLSEPLDCRSDIYSFGLILYEMLTGEVAVSGQNIFQIKSSHLNGFPQKLIKSKIRDSRLCSFLINCSSRDQENRFTDWGILLEEYKVIYFNRLNQLPPENVYPIDISLYGQYQKASSFLSIGSSYIDSGDYSKSKNFYIEALQISKKINSKQIEGAVLSNLGLIESHQGNYSEALNLMNSSLNISRKNEDITGEVAILGNIGGVYQNQGDYKRAHRYFSKSLTIAYSHGLDYLLASQYGNLAINFADQGLYSIARKYYQMAIDQSMKINAQITLSNNYANLGNLLFMMGEFAEAEDQFSKAQDIVEKFALKHRKGNLLANISNLAIQKGELDNAKLFNSIALEIFDQLNDKKGEINVLVNFGSICSAELKFKEAKNYFDDALAKAEKINDKNSLCSIYLGIGNLYIQMGNLISAIQPLKTCIENCKLVNNKNIEASATGNLGKVYAALFDFENAKSWLENSINIAKPRNFEMIQARSEWTLGVIYEIMGDLHTAKKLMCSATIVFRKYDLPEYGPAKFHLDQI